MGIIPLRERMDKKALLIAHYIKDDSREIDYFPLTVVRALQLLSYSLHNSATTAIYPGQSDEQFEKIHSNLQTG